MKFTSVLLAVLLGTAAWAQKPVAAGAETTHLSVLVTDDHGAPIRDLAGKDFGVESGGKSQPGQIRSFAPIAEPVVVSDGEFTDRNNPAKGRGLVVIVLDTIHTRWMDEKDVRPLITGYLASCARANSPVSLLVMDPDDVLHSVHDYATSSVTLAAALERSDAIVHGRTSAAEVSPDVAAEAARLVDFLKGTTANFTAESQPLRARPEPVLRMFRTMAEATLGIPGRKSLVWITNITPFEVDEKTGMVATLSGFGGDSIVGASNEHREMLTPDEVKALRPIWKSSMTALLRAQVAVVAVSTRRSAATSFDPQMLHAMHVVADMTGGREIHGPDPFLLLADLPAQTLAAYDLAAPSNSDGCKSDWCRLRITVDRPGAHVFAPTGFFRDPKAGGDDYSLAAGLAAPLDFMELPFTLSWASNPPSPEAKRRVGFVVTFPPEAEMPEPTGNQLNLEILVRATGAHGGNPQNATFNAAGQLSPEQAQQAHEKGFALNNVIELAPGEYTIKFLIHDKLTGRLGSITVPLKVS
jgi:VWFA-related protein